MHAEPGPPFTHTARLARHYLTGLRIRFCSTFVAVTFREGKHFMEAVQERLHFRIRKPSLAFRSKMTNKGTCFFCVSRPARALISAVGKNKQTNKRFRLDKFAAAAPWLELARTR